MFYAVFCNDLVKSRNWQLCNNFILPGTTNTVHASSSKCSQLKRKNIFYASPNNARFSSTLRIVPFTLKALKQRFDKIEINNSPETSKYRL